MRVLVTRPEPDAGRTATKLRERGHDAVLLPLTETVALPEGLARLKEQRAGAYAVTSGAAIRFWRQDGIVDRQTFVTLRAVGSRTAGMAAAAGFRTVRPGPGTAEKMADDIIADHGNGGLPLTPERPLVYVAGQTRKNVFEAMLAAAEVPFVTVEIYKIDELSYSTDFLVNEIAIAGGDVVLLYSGVAASRFFSVFGTIVDSILLKNIHYLCIGASVTDAVPEPYAGRCLVSETPDEASLLSLLDRLADDKI